MAREQSAVLMNLARAQQLVSQEGIDVAISSRPENFSYVSGITTRLEHYFVREKVVFSALFPDREPALIVPWFERSVVRELTAVKDVISDSKWGPKDKSVGVPYTMVGSAEKFLADFLGGLGLESGRIGVDEYALPLRVDSQLRQYLPKAKHIFVTKLFSRIRMVKTPTEVSRIQKACEITSAGYEAVEENLDEGVTESELATMARDRMLEQGADEMVFMFMTAGSRAGVHHVVPSDHRIKKGELLKCDMGVRYKGYVSDIGRTFICGTPTHEQWSIYRRLLNTHTRILDAIEPGVTGADLFSIYLRNQKGEYGGIPWPSCGHGIGLELHESPGLSPTDRTPIQAGMVLAVEVGYLKPNKVGYHLEDIVLVTKDGHRNLTNAEKDTV